VSRSRDELVVSDKRPARALLDDICRQRCEAFEPDDAETLARAMLGVIGRVNARAH